jgi:ribosomal protein S18 acetylase RimI-like enzyme
MSKPAPERPFDGNLQIHNFRNRYSFVAAGTCREIGREAWSSQLQRTPDEIAHAFTTKKSFETISDMLIANRRARMGGRLSLNGSGVLLFAKLPSLPVYPDEQTIGYAIVRQAESGSLPARAVKSFVMRQQPYVNIQSINVRPEYQGMGVGSALIHAALEHFGADQKPTAYVFEENQRGLETFGKMGFVKTPAGQEPEPQKDYFGPNTQPPRQWRLEAESAYDVQVAIVDRLGDRFPEYVTVDI